MNLRFLLLIAATLSAAASHPAPPPSDMAAAISICDETPLHRIEGIWSFPDDHVTVAILRDDQGTGYAISVVESDDASLSGGMRIGTLMPTPDTDRYRMTLCTALSDGLPALPRDFAATFHAQEEALTIEGAKLKFSLSLNRILPKFLKFIHIRTSNPTERLSHGMLRAYPSYDGNGSSRREPTYL